MVYEMMTKDVSTEIHIEVSREIHLAVWNCNGALWTHPGRLEEVMEGHDIVLLTETRQSPERGLPRVEGYQWESAYRGATRQSTIRGSGGIAMLVRREMQRRVQVVARDPEARYMWIRLQLSEIRVLYIALCYFSPRGSRYATLGGKMTWGMGRERSTPW